MPVDVGKLTPPELVTLRYDLAVDLYRRRAKALEVEALAREGKQLPYYVYKYFGDLGFANVALTLNPYWQFDKEIRDFSNKKYPGLYPVEPAPVNRYRNRMVVFPVRRQYTTYTVNGMITGTELHWSGDHWSYPVRRPEPWPQNGTVEYQTGYQQPVYATVADTTWKSRNPGVAKIPKKGTKAKLQTLCALGEYESWRPRFTSPDVTCSWVPFDYSWNDFWSSALITSSSGTLTVSSHGGSANVDPTTSYASSVAEHNFALSEMTRRVDSLVAACLPTRRNFNAFYQIGELRDLPQTLRGTLTAWRDVEAIIGKAAWQLASVSPKFWTRSMAQRLQAPLARVGVFIDPDKALSSAYLTYKFGWQSMVQACDQLMNAPKKATKELNYLIAKNGQNITLSTIQHLPDSEWTSHPAISPYVLYPMLPDPDHPLSQDGWRQASIRCVVNCGVQFPSIEEPILRQVLYADKLGLFPRPSDILNLIPWTWLIDWFFGLSNYLRLVEEVQGDYQLINWGMATYTSYLSSTATIGSFMLYNEFTHNASGSVHNLTVRKAECLSTGKFEAVYRCRVGVQSLARVKLASGFGLSETQKAILTALISQPLSYRKA